MMMGIDEGVTETLETHYEVYQVLGKGGFSEVKLGVSKSDGSKVAIKTIRYYPENDMAKSLLKNELFVMTQVESKLFSHPNLIHVLDVFESQDGVHLVLEHCSGGELFERIVKQEKYSEKEAAAVVKQIANGLHALHEKGISHRDLKPENCLYLSEEKDSPLKLIDFGLSQVNGYDNSIVALFGSLDYVSPEILQSNSVTPSSDMWSLGVILYILLCGSPPFYGPDIKTKKNLIFSGKFSLEDDIWISVSEEAKQLVKCLLSVDPSQRPTAQQVLNSPWVKGESARLEPMASTVAVKIREFNARQKFRGVVLASMLSNKLKSPDTKLKNLMQENQLDIPNLEEIKGFGETFKQISSDGQSVSRSEFVQVLDRLNKKHLIPFADRIFNLFDGNKNGIVEYNEIMRGFFILQSVRGDRALELCFKIYDQDNSGYLTKDELSLVLRSLPFEYSVYLVHLDKLFDVMDLNKDGKISFEEFKSYLNNYLEGGYFLVNQLIDSSQSIPLFR